VRGARLRARVAPSVRLAAAAALAAAHRLSPDRLYHRVTETGATENRLLRTVRRRDLERQLALLRRCYRAVALEALPDAAAWRRRGGRIPIALTFDDDLPEQLAVAAPALERAGLPATFFLTGAGLDDNPSQFWWESLQVLADRGQDAGPLVGLPPGATVTSIAANLREAAPEQREASAAALAAAAGPQPPPLSAADIRALARRFAIGFHTRRHAYLPTLDDGGLSMAMREGRPELEAVVGDRLLAIAYPHGGADARTAPAARAAGFELGLTTEARGLGSDPLAIGRVEPKRADLPSFWLALEQALDRPSD
jgi:peptidoglycan/xylan/chitin deacetylase (PgdA/CDA1 family)